MLRPCGRQADEDDGAARPVELDQRRPGRDAAEQVVLELAADERGERALAGHLGPGAGNEQPDRGPIRVARRIERRHDPHLGLAAGAAASRKQAEDRGAEERCA